MSEFDKASPWGKMRRCLLLDNGIVNYYLDPSDSNKKEDGSPAKLDGTDGQVMVEIPKFWYRKTVVGDDIEFVVSDKAGEGLVVHPAFYRDRNNDGVAEEVDYRYCSAFMGYNNGGKLESRSDVLPTVSQTIGAFRNQAIARGNGWGILDYNLVYAIQMLYITEFGHPDSQTQIGRGYVDGNNSSIKTGGTIQHGNQTFGETTGKKQMSYRGIEDLWGNTYYWLDGLKTDNYDILIGNVNFNDTGNGYKRITNANKSNVAGNISDIHDDADAGFIIKSTNNNTSYNNKLYDYSQLYSSYLPCFGASWSVGSSSGLFYIRLDYSASSSASAISARLSF